MAPILTNYHYKFYGNLKNFSEILYSERGMVAEIRINRQFPRWQYHDRDPARLVNSEKKIGFKFLDNKNYAGGIVPSIPIEYHSFLSVHYFDYQQEMAVGDWEAIAQETLCQGRRIIVKVPFENIWQHYYKHVGINFVDRVKKLLTS